MKLDTATVDELRLMLRYERDILSRYTNRSTDRSQRAQRQIDRLEAELARRHAAEASHAR